MSSRNRVGSRGIPAMASIHFGYRLWSPLQGKKLSLNFRNLCKKLVKKLISEIRKCPQLQSDFVPLLPASAPLPLGASLSNPIIKCAPLADGLDPPLPRN